MRVPLSRGMFALVDRDDLPLVQGLSWFAVPGDDVGRIFYAACRNPDGSGVQLRMHRVIAGAIKGQLVDHRNHDGLDNRRCNLRICTPAENAMNSRRRVGKAGFRGVKVAKRRFQAMLQCHGGGGAFLGSFATAEEAARAYDAAALRKFGEFAKLNFPEAVL